jgi:hypothetical protein
MSSILLRSQRTLAAATFFHLTFLLSLCIFSRQNGVFVDGYEENRFE